MAPNDAHAQAMMDFQQVDATPKGTIGLGLVGAELGFVIPAAAGLDEVWSLTVFPIVGAAGGATAGWFLIDNNGESEIAVGTLAFGMAMIVPSMVLTLSATAYDPDDETRQIEGTPPQQPGGQEQQGAPPGASRGRHIARAGPGALKLSSEGVLLGLPGLKVRPRYTREEMQRYGGNQATEVHFALVSGVF
jgi:hypothetical protein